MPNLPCHIFSHFLVTLWAKVMCAGEEDTRVHSFVGHCAWAARAVALQVRSTQWLTQCFLRTARRETPIVMGMKAPKKGLPKVLLVHTMAMTVGNLVVESAICKIGAP